MDIPFGAIEKELNIDKETFDAIISDQGSRSKICGCLQYCLENVPDLMWTSALALQYISAVAGDSIDQDMSESKKKRKWHERRMRYLNGKGYSDDKIYALEGMIRLHIHGHDIDSKMHEFAEQNRQLILDTALFELQAANTWKEIAIAIANKNIEDAKAKMISGEYGWIGDADYVQKKLAQEVSAAELELERVSGAIRLYRHGDYNSDVLSFTTNPEGVIINKGTVSEKKLVPDHSSTIDELIKSGYHPVAGFGALMNDYAGEQSEVIFVHLPALPEERSGTNFDSAYDEWLEENIDQFKDDKQEAAFAKFLRDTPDEDKADYGMIDLIFKTWRQEHDIRSRKDSDDPKRQCQETSILTEDMLRAAAQDAKDQGIDYWITVNGTHIPIDDEGNLKGKTGEKISSTSKKAEEPKAPEWKSKNDTAREEHKAKKPSAKAIELTELYDVEEGDKYDQILEAFKAKDGSLDALVDHYYDIMERNGDPTPTKATADQRRNFKEIVDSEYGGDWDDARFGEMKKDCGLEGEEAEKVFKSLKDWVGFGYRNADKNDLDKFVETAPAYEGTMYRGLHFEPDEGTFDQFMEGIKEGSTMKMQGPASWAGNDEVARNFAHMGDGTYDSVIVKCVKNRTSTPIGYINAQGEDEILSGSKAAWTVLNVEQYERHGGRKAIITVVEKGA